MAKNTTDAVAIPETDSTVPKSVKIASSGITTDQDAASFLSALIGDTLTNKVPVREANATINAMGKMLKLVELRHRYGSADGNGGSLKLVEELEPVPETEQDRCKRIRKEELLRELAALEGETAS